jgi:hypothetical protein
MLVRKWLFDLSVIGVALFCTFFGVAQGTGCESIGAEEINLEVLMGQLAQAKDGRANFIELRYLSVLEKPLKIQGTLTYEASGRITKLTVKPYREKITVLEDEVFIENDEGLKKMDLGWLAPVKAATESLRAILHGDRERLLRNYKTKVAGSIDCWQIDLAPKKGDLGVFLKEIQIKGANGEIKSIQYVETNGDRTLMHLTND